MNWAAPSDLGYHNAQVLGYKLRMKELCPTSASTGVAAAKTFMVAETIALETIAITIDGTVGAIAAVGTAVVQGSNTGTVAVATVATDTVVYVTVTALTFDTLATVTFDGGTAKNPTVVTTTIDHSTSPVLGLTLSITLSAAISGLASAGAAVVQLNTGATGILAAPATATDTVVVVTVTSGTFDNAGSNTLTIGDISGAKTPSAIVSDDFGLPVLASCETLYVSSGMVALQLAVGVTLGASATTGEAVVQFNSGATGTVAATGGSSDTIVYVTVTAGTFTTNAADTITVNGGSPKVVYAVDYSSTEPVSFVNGQSTSTPYEVTGVYTPSSGQNHDATCATACATIQCTATGTWADDAAILHTTTGCSGCYPQNPTTDAGCFPGAVGYPTAALTLHAIAGLKQDKYYSFEVAAFNHFGTGAWSSNSYAVHTHSAPNAPTAVTKFAEAIDGTSAGIYWSDAARIDEGTDTCTSATAMTYRTPTCAGYSTKTNAQKNALCDLGASTDIIVTSAALTALAPVGTLVSQAVTLATGVIYKAGAIGDTTLYISVTSAPAPAPATGVFTPTTNDITVVGSTPVTPTALVFDSYNGIVSYQEALNCGCYDLTATVAGITGAAAVGDLVSQITPSAVNGAVTASTSVTIAIANTLIAVGQTVTDVAAELVGTVTVAAISGDSLTVTLSSAQTLSDTTGLQFALATGVIVEAAIASATSVKIHVISGSFDTTNTHTIIGAGSAVAGVQPSAYVETEKAAPCTTAGNAAGSYTTTTTDDQVSYTVTATDTGTSAVAFTKTFTKTTAYTAFTTAALDAVAAVGSVVTQTNSGATGVLAVAAVTGDTTLYVTVDSGSAAFTTTAVDTLTLTVGSTASAVAPSAMYSPAYKVTGLAAAKAYSLTVSTTNKAGTSVVSTAATWNSRTVPDAPLAPIASVVTENSIALSWVHAVAAATVAQTAATDGITGLVGQTKLSTGISANTDGFKLYAQSCSTIAADGSCTTWVPAVRSTLGTDGSDLIAAAEYLVGTSASATEDDVNYWEDSGSTTLDDDGDGSADWLKIKFFTSKKSSQQASPSSEISTATFACHASYTFCPVDTVTVPYLAAGTRYRFKLLFTNAVGDSVSSTVTSNTCGSARLQLTVGAIDSDATVGTTVTQDTSLATGVLTAAASAAATTIVLAVTSGTFTLSSNDVTLSGQAAKTPSAGVYLTAESSTTCPEALTLDKAITDVRIYSGPPCVYNPSPSVASVRPNSASTTGATTFAVSSAGTNVKYRWQLKATDETGTSILYSGTTDDPDAEAGGSKIGTCLDNADSSCAVMEYSFPFPGLDDALAATSAYDEVVIQVIASNTRGIVTEEVAFTFDGHTRVTLASAVDANAAVGTAVAQATSSAAGRLARTVTSGVDTVIYVTLDAGSAAFDASNTVTITGVSGIAATAILDVSDANIESNTIEYCGCTDQADPNYWAFASFTIPEECAGVSTFGDEGISSVTAGKWEYFQLFFSEKTYAADVTLRVDSGSVDMYVSAKSMPDPGRSDSYFASGYATGEVGTTAIPKTAVTGVSNFHVARLPYKELAQSGTSYSIFVAVKGVEAFSRFQVVGTIDEFKTHTPEGESLLYAAPYCIKLTAGALASEGAATTVVTQGSATGTLTRKALAGATTLYVTVDAGSVQFDGTTSLTVSGITAVTPTAVYDLRFERIRLLDLTLSSTDIKLTVAALASAAGTGTLVSQATSLAIGVLASPAAAGDTVLFISVTSAGIAFTATTNAVTVTGQAPVTPSALGYRSGGIDSTLQSGEYDFMEFYYPHSANDLDVELTVVTTIGGVELYTSRVDRFPSPERATTTNTYGYWGPPNTRGYTGSDTTCAECHSGVISSTDIKLTVAAIASDATAGTAITQATSLATGVLAEAATAGDTTLYIAVTSAGIAFTPTTNAVRITGQAPKTPSALVNQNLHSFLYTIKPTDSSGKDGILYIGVKGAYPVSWNSGDDLQRNVYSIKAKVYRYRVESDLLEPGRPVGTTAGDDTTGGSLTTEDRYSVVTQDNFNYYEIKLSRATYKLKVDLTVHYGTVAVYTSNTALPTQDKSLQLTTSGVIGYTTGDVISTTDASGTIDATFSLDYSKLNMVDNYVYIGIIARNGEASYDLTVEETTFGVASPTDLYLCAYETAGTASLTATGTNVGLTDACTTIPGSTPSGSTVSIAAPGAGLGHMMFYQVYIGPKDTEMQSVSRRSGAGSRTTDISTDSASWGNDWTEQATTTWTQQKEYDYDVDIAIHDGLDGTPYTVYASTTVMYPSARTGTSTTVSSQGFTSGTTNDASLIIPVYTQAQRILYIGIEIASGTAAGQLSITKSEIASTRSTPTTIGSTTGFGGPCADEPCGAYGTCVYDANDSTRKNALTGVVSHYCICDDGFYGADCSVGGFGRVAAGPSIALPADFQGYKATMNTWTAGTSTCGTAGGDYKTAASMIDDATTNAATPAYGLACLSGGTWTDASKKCATGNVWEPYVETNDGSIYSGCTTVGAGVITDPTTCQASCDALTGCNAFNVENGAFCTLLACPTGSVTIATTVTSSAYTFKKVAHQCCKSTPSVSSTAGASDTVCPAADIIAGVSTEEECELILGATDQITCEIAAEAAAAGGVCTALSITTAASSGACDTLCTDYVATGGMGCTDKFFYDSTSPNVDYCVLYFCPTAINSDGTTSFATLSTSQAAVLAAQTCGTTVASTESACEQAAYPETPSSACPPAAVLAGVTNCDSFEAVTLDCESQDCKPSTDATQAYKVGYIACTNGGAVCTVNAAQPIVTIPFSVSGLPAYAKVAAYVDGKPYPSKSSNTMHFVSGCASADKACIAAGTAAFADSSLKVYDLEPLGAGVKHTAVLMLMTDNGEPLGSVQTAFEVGYGGGCEIATDGTVCGGRGTCHLGYCVCYDGYYGNSCDRNVEESGATCAAATSSTVCTAASDVTQGFTCTWDVSALLCKATFAASGAFTVNEAYEKRQQYLTQSKLGETRFLNKRMLEASSAMLTRSDATMVSTTSTLKNNLDTFMGTLSTDISTKLAAVQTNVNALYAKSARNVVKLQQAREESLRLQTTNLEEKLDMQRSLASHQRNVQNRLDSKRFDAYRLNAVKMDKLKQEFARSRFTINQLKTANGPLVDTTQFKETACTADQFYNVDCTETTTDRSSLYTGTGYRTAGTVDTSATSGATASPNIVIEGTQVPSAYTDSTYGEPINRG